MDWFDLHPHPDYPCSLPIKISVLAEREGGALKVLYRISGDDTGLRVPPPGAKGRTNELWKTTCFEAFVRVDKQPGYSELNFSPWGEWAADSFDSYRSGMRDLFGREEPFAFLGYKTEMEDGSYGRLYSTIDAFDRSADWQLGLTAVIETDDRTKSYWALSHPPGPPDFHDSTTWTVCLPATA